MLSLFVSKVKRGRCANSDGFCAEMFKRASVNTKNCDLFNDSFKTAHLESSWRHNVLVMLPKFRNLREGPFQRLAFFAEFPDQFTRDLAVTLRKTAALKRDGEDICVAQDRNPKSNAQLGTFVLD